MTKRVLLIDSKEGLGYNPRKGEAEATGSQRKCPSKMGGNKVKTFSGGTLKCHKIHLTLGRDKIQFSRQSLPTGGGFNALSWVRLKPG